MLDGLNRNPKDPIYKQNDADRVKFLMAKWGEIANEFSYEDVINAGLNMTIVALRQKHKRWEGAEIEWNDIAGKAKQVLKDHYDSFGRIKGIFPFTQHLFPSLMKAGKLFGKRGN